MSERKQQHTPGPWRVRYDTLDGWHPRSNPVVETSAGNDPLTQLVGHPGIEDPERSANAALIAAAPRLLAACEAALEDLTELTDGTASIEDMLGIFPQLRSAIRAARGESA